MRGALLTAVLFLLLPALANAQQSFQAFTQTKITSSDTWGTSATRGWSFTVASPITVNQLGFWDSDQDGLAIPHSVGLWRDDGTLLTSTTVPGGTSAPLDGTFRWSATSAVVLQPGTMYVIGAYAPIGNPDRRLGLGENVVFDSRVTMVEGRVAITTPLHYPPQPAPVELTANFKATGPNRPPVANAGPDKNAYTNIPVLLDGSATDPDGDPILDWSWAVEQAPAPRNYRLVSADTENLILIGYLQGDYVVSLTAGDGIDIGIDYATIHVADNIPPVAVATADRTTIRVGETVCFDGSQSYDPESGPLTNIWDFPDGSPAVINDLTVCHQFTTIDTFNVGLQVTDERGAYDFDYVDITVLAPAAVPALPRSGLWLLGLLLSLAGAAQISRRVEGKA